MKMLLLFLTFNCCFSQAIIDTSYTIHSTYNKEVKKFPFIKKAVFPINNKVQLFKDVSYKTIQNRNLTLDIFIKKDNNSHAGVILIHGGGWKSGNKTQMHSLAHEIATNGFTCICVEFRLSDEAKFPAGILDIKSAIQFVKKNAQKYSINKNQIAVLGCSSGGQMATLIGTTNGNRKFEEHIENNNSDVQAIINLDGILAFNHPESQEGKLATLWLNGSYEEVPNIWKEASALEHCNSKTPPILFINSPITRFHAGENDMINKLRDYGIHYEVKNIANAPHSFWFFHPWFEEVVNSSTQFLNTIFNK
ncbi:alpha/beta hydrolase [Flavobacterium branchiophilum]|uniref:Esterase n=1 Tax=Flavobacterium branchiophilum TaxID=55197 RepID=A0A2H3KNH4_9FLAO|nr:alpha/beta hydrolase [Flavobacterium branchiophilum]PDS22449.1 esterase [Flavobacterium branchiophilum]